jgi:peptide/nickel transport system substrate-binding protein
MRQAVLEVANQADYLTALAGDPANWQLCPSYFTCGGPMANTAGSEALTGPRDYDKAKKLVAEAGYKGEPVVVLDAVDQPVAHSQALVVTDEMKKLGLNVEVQSMDWGTLVTRRASKEPTDKGGWSIFATGWVGADLLDPAINPALRTNGEKGHFGWPADAKIEGIARQVDEGRDVRRAQEDRRGDAAARVRDCALSSDRPVLRENRLSQEHQGRARGAGIPVLERREDLSLAGLQTPAAA